MTEESYYEMCAALGSEPIEEEIPVTLSRLPEDIQVVFNLFFKLPDRWESMSGTYLGKDLSCYREIAEILEIENQKFTLDLVLLIDSVRSEFLLKKQQEREAANKNKIAQ